MPYDPHKHHRRSIRLKGYDYSQDGIYFVSICVKNGLCLFGDVIDGEMILNPAGIMVEQAWLALPERFPQVELDIFRAMPNHFHALLGIRNTNLHSVGAGLVPALDVSTLDLLDLDEDRATTRVALTVVLGDMVGAFKSITTNE